MSELAVFGLSDGRLLLGHGPFEHLEGAPASGVAFYRNDFALSDPAPWRVPDRVEELVPESGPLATRAVAWRNLEVTPFAEVFAEISGAIRKGAIEKTVPVVTELGELTERTPESVLEFISRLPAPLRTYGWSDGEQGMVGASPELLFRLERGKLETMALAGTARTEERDAFVVDEKEIREHEFVAQTLLSKLSDLGMTRRYDRETMDLPGLVHFLSRIEVELYRNEPVNELIRRFHPTPALGPLPRTTETMAQLVTWRETLGSPPGFGAPFGVSIDGTVEVLVAIRMMAWDGHEVRIPSGCGVIEESRLVSEWRELRLKREAVRRLFGLG